MTEAGILTFAYILDLVIGDPRQFPHPVRGIGWTIERAERMLRKKTELRAQRPDKKKERLAGLFLVMIIVGPTYGFIYFVTKILLDLNFSVFVSYLSLLLFIYIVSTTIATRDLLKSGQDVIEEVNAVNIEIARKKLGMIVGRDTNSLEEKGILKAVIETLSENASDGIIAPLFYYAIGGLPLAMTYKAINTLDSMVGYKNEKYKNFGWAAARLDDIANYIPARLTGFFIVAATFFLSVMRRIKHAIYIRSNGLDSLIGLNGLNAFKIMIRDGNNHSSPNSGIPEAAMAGALGIQLGGPSLYGGVKVEKPFLGEEVQNADKTYLIASEQAMTITKVTSFLGLLFALTVLYLRTAIWS